jgi:uncharacterized tellurite resistance protein B-like protein
MLNTMNNWLKQDKGSHTTREVQLNITKLMVGMMAADGHFDEFEFHEIQFFLTENFDFTPAESRRFVEQVKLDYTDDDTFDSGVQTISSSFSIEERGYILSMVWRIALIDGKISANEELYLDRLSHLLDVPEETLSQLKKAQERDFPDMGEREPFKVF